MDEKSWIVQKESTLYTKRESLPNKAKFPYEKHPGTDLPELEPPRGNHFHFLSRLILK